MNDPFIDEYLEWYYPERILSDLQQTFRLWATQAKFDPRRRCLNNSNEISIYYVICIRDPPTRSYEVFLRFDPLWESDSEKHRKSQNEQIARGIQIDELQIRKSNCGDHACLHNEVINYEETDIQIKILPNITKNIPPIIGSGIVTNRAPNLPITPRSMTTTAATWITRRLPTCVINNWNSERFS